MKLTDKLSGALDLAARLSANPAVAGKGRYDRLIDAANRLPRPLLAYGTVALFALALLAPATFERAMASLDRMPEELWWLLGAVLIGHFGAREAHHLRHRPAAEPPADTPVAPREAGNP